MPATAGMTIYRHRASSILSPYDFRPGGNSDGNARHRRLHLRAGSRFPQDAARGVTRHGQPRGDRLPRPGLCLPAQETRRSWCSTATEITSTSWGTGEVTDPHGLKIVNDIVYTTDRSDSVAKSFTLDGKPLLELGQRGVHSDTGCTGAPWLAPRAAGPFNHPTEMIAPPERRHLRHRRLSQCPRASLHARRHNW